MALDFQIEMCRNGQSLQLSLAGDFDRESASQLIKALKHNQRGVSLAVIETSGLDHVASSGKKLFQKKVHTLSDFCYRLVFTGKNAGEFVPSWTYCF